MRNDPQSPLSLEQIALALSPFTAGLRVSSAEMAKIREYVEILAHWNQVISLTAVDDKTEIVARHFGESIFGASAVPIHSGRLADVGSGAGFPGLPLKIVSEGLSVVLLEPNLKKCAFLKEVTGKLGLSDVEINRSRHEDYRPGGAPFDFVCSRALGGHRGLLRWARSVLTPDGRVVLWLGEDDSVLVGRTPGWSWDLPIRIPESRKRVIQVGRPLLE